jgi:ABC-type transport system involved in cytochrome c biogenesis permease component
LWLTVEGVRRANHPSFGRKSKVTIAVGLLISLIIGANAISEEQENETLEGLLVTPVSRRQIILGKFLAAYRPGLSCRLAAGFLSGRR